MDTLSTNFNEELCDIFFDNPDYYLDAHYQNNWLKNKYESFKSQSGKNDKYTVLWPGYWKRQPIVGNDFLPSA